MDASRLFLDHFSKHLSSVLGRTELCHEVRNPRPQKPQIICNENHHLALLDWTCPDPRILAFFDFLAFFRFPISLAFLCVFPFFSKDFRGSAKRKTLVFFSGFPLHFPKKQGLEGQGVFLFCPFLSFLGLSDFSGIFPNCSGMVQGFSRFVLFLFLGLLRAPPRNSPERVRDTIWTFPQKSGKPPGLETSRFSFSQ